MSHIIPERSSSMVLPQMSFHSLSKELSGSKVVGSKGSGSTIRRLARGIPAVAEPAGAAYARAKGTIHVVDAETGQTLILNTKSALDIAMERGDEDDGGAMSSSSLVHALPRLCDDDEKSAALHMLIEKMRLEQQREVQEQQERERLRIKVLHDEPMQWRRLRLRKRFGIDRIEEMRALEEKRKQSEAELMKTAREIGLL